ncbi:MAG: aminotransferase class III-fold pyridoxal phosphate-dependent enzyme [bacterium]
MLKTKCLSDKEIREIDSKYSSYGDTVHYSEQPKVFKECDGSFVYDTNDVPFLDIQMWYSASNFGYNNKRISTALIDQIDKMPQIAPQFLYDYKVLLSQKICEASYQRFGSKGRTHFNVGGSQAVEDALKLVRNATKKNLMFAFMGGYHGRTLGASAITSSYRYRRRFGHFSERAHFIPYPYCFRCFYGKNCDSCDFYCLDQFEKMFETEYNSFWDNKTGETEFIAFFAEAIQGTGGYIIPPKGYFERFKNILDQYNILLVDDEVQMGFYRTGKLWAIEHFNVNPDVVVFGKSLTNGMNPLSGLWAKEELIKPDIFPPGSTHSTFSSNPLGTRAGYEVMSMLEEVDHENLVTSQGKKFLEGLEYLKKKHKKIGNVDGIGLALRLEICENDGYTPNKDLTDRIVEEGLKGNLEYNGKKYGLVLDVGGYYKNVLTIAPSLYIKDSEINMAVDLLDQLFTRFNY